MDFNGTNLNSYIFNKSKINRTPTELKWNVLYESSNKIKVYNIFNHYSFYKSLYKLKKEEDFDKFSESVNSELMYYFWSKSEYEIIITSWPTFITQKEYNRIINEPEPLYRLCVDLDCEEKIDIYTQVKLNWDTFITYLWENKKLIKRIK